MGGVSDRPMAYGKASICNWDLRAAFLTKEQATKAVGLLLAEDIDFNVQFSTEIDATRTLYIIDIDGMSWANNLATVAGILQQVDYPD